MDRIRIGYPAGYLGVFRIRIGFRYLFLTKIGSGYLFDFYNEFFLRVIQDVTSDYGSIFLAMVFTFTKKSKFFCHVLHLSQSMIIRVILS